MSKTAIIDYEAGNLTSVARAVRHLGGDAVVTRRAQEILDAERVIFPGVGAAGAAMESLESLGLTDTLREAFARGTPILGICVGSQVIFEHSEEDDGTPGLGLLPGSVVRFRFAEGATEKIPHMGWNQVEFLDAAGAAPVSRGHPVFAGIESGSEFYFVHSYYPEPARPEDLLATAVYGGVRFACAVGRDNLVAVQFHAEKSGRFGLRLLENFLRWRT